MSKEWIKKNIEDICEKPQYGFTASATEKKVGPKFLRITDITSSGVDWNKMPFCDCPPEKLSKYNLHHNDILFARIGATTGKSFIVKNPPQSVFASYLIRLRAKEIVNPDFLYYYFQTPFYWNQINANKDNNLKGGVNGSVLSKLEVSCPPIPEQKKIAAILFIIQKAIEVQESIIKTTQELKKSTMQHLFTYGLRGEKTKETEIGRMPESWQKITIGKLGEIITGTTPPTANKEYYMGGGYQFISPADFGKTTKIHTTLKEVSAKGLYVSRVLPKGSVCFVCIGSTIGKVGITVKEKAATNQQINSILVKDDLIPYFVMYLLIYKSEYIASFASPSPVPILSKGKFEEIEIMICLDKKEQSKIAHILKTIDDKIELHTAKKSALQDIFKTILNKLMTGEIRVKDLDVDVSEVSG